MILGCPVDAPSVRIEDQVVTENITFIGQPIYGRILFTRHEPIINRNTFNGVGIILHNIIGARITNNRFIMAEVAITVEGC